MYRYYASKMQGHKNTVDFEILKEYFPLETVLSGMISIFEKLFGLKIKQLKNGEVRSILLFFAVSQFLSYCRLGTMMC